MRSVLAIYKKIKSRIALVPNFCNQCGSSTEIFSIPERYWLEVVGRSNRNNVYCIGCFNRMAWEQSFIVTWSANFNDQLVVDDCVSPSSQIKMHVNPPLPSSIEVISCEDFPTEDETYFTENVQDGSHIPS